MSVALEAKDRKREQNRQAAPGGKRCPMSRSVGGQGRHAGRGAHVVGSVGAKEATMWLWVNTNGTILG